MTTTSITQETIQAIKGALATKKNTLSKSMDLAISALDTLLKGQKLKPRYFGKPLLKQEKIAIDLAHLITGNTAVYGSQRQWEAGKKHDFYVTAPKQPFGIKELLTACGIQYDDNWIDEQTSSPLALDKETEKRLSGKTQVRGICTYCFGEFATKNGRMVSHGYSLNPFIGKLGECHGYRKPHYGSPAAKAEIADTIKKLENAKKEDPKQARKLAIIIDSLKLKLDEWKPRQLKIVDIDEEEKERRAELKRTKEARARQKELAEKERQAKADARKKASEKKWATICEQAIHQVELDGEIIAQWEQAYSNRSELERDHGDRAYTALKARYPDTDGQFNQDRIYAGWRLINRVRTLDNKKQLCKF